MRRAAHCRNTRALTPEPGKFLVIALIRAATAESLRSFFGKFARHGQPAATLTGVTVLYAQQRNNQARNTSTVTTRPSMSSTTKKGIAGAVIGAVVCSIFLPGVGTLVGAGIGTALASGISSLSKKARKDSSAAPKQHPPSPASQQSPQATPATPIRSDEMTSQATRFPVRADASQAGPVLHQQQ